MRVGGEVIGRRLMRTESYILTVQVRALLCRRPTLPVHNGVSRHIPWRGR